MYIMAAALGALCSYLFWRLLSLPLTPWRTAKALGMEYPSDLFWRLFWKESWWLWLAYALAGAAAIYTHYLAAAILLFHGLAALLWGRTLKWWGGWVAAQVGVGVLYLPWLPQALASLTQWPAVGPALTPADVIELRTY